ncbi:MAG: flagellin lysine-N-methylase [Clostridiales bacterium]|nr:flagellin lysine-N-methylase [Clostridiales bacterium]
MKLITPDFYKDFKCIAGNCPDSCCAGWEVDADEKSLDYYKTLSGDLRNRIDSVLTTDEFGNTVFKLTESKRCPFLNNNNLCDIHISEGGEHTPYTCRTFPRFINDFGGTREMGISFSCPVASDMMWNLEEKFDFCEGFNSIPPSLNDIDAELYYILLNSRKAAYAIVQNQFKSVSSRICELLDYGLKVQSEINPYEEANHGIDFIDVFKNPENINPQWVEKVKSYQFNPNVVNTISSENIAMYFLFRYFMQAVYDKDVLSKVKMAAVGALIPAFFGNDSWTVHLWSKETEHSDINMERYKYQLRHNINLSVENLKKYFQ